MLIIRKFERSKENVLRYLFFKINYWQFVFNNMILKVIYVVIRTAHIK